MHMVTSPKPLASSNKWQASPIICFIFATCFSTHFGIRRVNVLANLENRESTYPQSHILPFILKQ